MVRSGFEACLPPIYPNNSLVFNLTTEERCSNNNGTPSSVVNKVVDLADAGFCRIRSIGVGGVTACSRKVFEDRKERDFGNIENNLTPVRERISNERPFFFHDGSIIKVTVCDFINLPSVKNGKPLPLPKARGYPLGLTVFSCDIFDGRVCDGCEVCR